MCQSLDLAVIYQMAHPEDPDKLVIHSSLAYGGRTSPLMEIAGENKRLTNET